MLARKPVVQPVADTRDQQVSTEQNEAQQRRVSQAPRSNAAAQAALKDRIAADKDGQAAEEDVAAVGTEQAGSGVTAAGPPGGNGAPGGPPPVGPP
ncbi:MAG: hypothetical protein FJ102_25070, partial [Deltaproteobacteria bacterium]|nr:hypothetical protein [Deltaproteobacteria bacterium]